MDAKNHLDSNSDILKAKIQVVENILHLQQEKIWQHPDFVELFAQHLMQLYFSVSASVPLMLNAIERSKKIAGECPTARALIPYFEEHVEEEKDHDLWVLEDLEVLGISREEVTSKIPPTNIAILIGSQYYYIEHAHPISMMAYLAVIEGNAINKNGLDNAVATTGIPKQALRSFYKHAELDIGHSEELWEFIDGLPLLPFHSQLMGSNAIWVVQQLARMAEDLLSSFNPNARR